MHPHQHKAINRVYSVGGRMVSYWTARRIRSRKYALYVKQKRAKVVAEREEKEAQAEAVT